MLERMWRNWIAHTPLVGMYNGTAAMKNSLAVSYKFKDATTIWPSHYTSEHLSQENENLCYAEICTEICTVELFE